MNLAIGLLGPLVGPECRRALGRGWLIVMRSLSALALTGAALLIVGVGWIAEQSDPNHRPFLLLRIGMLILELMAIVAALILSPALMAGCLAGEQTRGALYLLLTTGVTSREIVLGRVTAKLGQVAMILLAGLPALVLIGALDALSPAEMLTLFLLPTAVAFGLGGIAAGASVLSKRGRDALLSVYLLVLLVLLSELVWPFLPTGWKPIGISPLGWDVLFPLVFEDVIGPAWTTIGLWTLAGSLGIAVAAWRLRPSCLGTDASGRKALRVRRRLVPAIGDRPMLWKELFIERSATLGKFGKVVGVGLVLYLGAGSLGLAAAMFWLEANEPGSSRAQRIPALMGWLYAGGIASLFAYLLEAAVGLRAAVAIASERERDTWDSLLTSPIDGGEIVVGKLWGSLYALRWLFLATLVCWTACLICGVMPFREYLRSLVMAMVVGAFAAAAGVRVSLATATATKAMGMTMGIWMGAGLAALVASWILAGIVGLFWIFVWMLTVSVGLATFAAGPWAPIRLEDLQLALSAALYIIATVMVASETRLRFDRIAGRMAGGDAQVAVDRLLHGESSPPVDLGTTIGEPAR